MEGIDRLNAALHARFDPDLVSAWRHHCRPRVLMVVDGLDYRPVNGFGLWRFLHAITVAPGVTNKPVLTLAHRLVHPPGAITIGTDNYTVLDNFNFASAATPVTLTHYDQVWMFGIRDGAFALTNAEVGVLSTFMNGGGGVFATGDHAALGREMCGSLPRIRRMREWRDAATGGVPMGTENDANLAVLRNDSVVNPGVGGVYEFADQSDDIPQRIYPNYRTIDTDGAAGPGWSTTVHPLLMLPGAPVTRSSSDAEPPLGFKNDIDVFPDHPHESQCYAVTAAATLDDTYNLAGQNFAEWNPMASNPAQRVGAELVALGVAGGRSVFNSVWKPPVKPRMFGIAAAYDGRLAQPYPGKTQRPGRIVCDSTWHHYVNINLDGTTSGRTGLGTGSGAAFVPSPDLQKIYTYYRNALSWLQPANRVWCSLWWDLVATRLHPELFEELLEAEHLTGWRDLIGLGRAAKSLASQVHGRAHVNDAVLGLLSAEERTQAVGDVLAGDALASTAISADELIDGLYGALLAEVARIVPAWADDKEAERLLAKGPEPHLRALQERVQSTLQLGIKHQVSRLHRSQALFEKLPPLGNGKAKK